LSRGIVAGHRGHGGQVSRSIVDDLSGPVRLIVPVGSRGELLQHFTLLVRSRPRELADVLIGYVAARKRP
jgi:hypothetical protein